MTVLALFTIELRLRARSIMPNATGRSLIAAAAVAWMVLWLLPLAWYGQVHPRNGATARGLAFGAIFTSGVIASLTVAGLSRILAETDRLSAWRVSPLPAYLSVALPVGALATVAVGAAAVLMFPPVLATGLTGWLDLIMAASYVGLGCLLGVLGPLVVVVCVARRRGTSEASRLAHAFPLPVLLVTVLGLRHLAQWNIDPLIVLFTLLVSSLILLPLSAWGLEYLMSRAIIGEGRTRESRPPRWGNASWGRSLLRTPFRWALIGLLPALLVSSRSSTIWATSLLALPMAANHALLRWEDVCPDRWRLARAGLKLRLSLLLRVGGPATLLVSTVALCSSSMTVEQRLVFVVAAFALLFCGLIRQAVARTALQALILALTIGWISVRASRG